MLIPWALLSYPHLFVPRAVISKGQEIGEPRFSANLLLHNTQPEIIAAIQQDILNTYLTKWPNPAQRLNFAGTVGGDPRAWNNTTPGYLRTPLVWGPTNPDSKGEIDPYAVGWVLLVAAQQDSPPTVAELVNGMAVKTSDPSKVYSGAECHAHVGIYGYPKIGQCKGISAGLNGIALTGRPTPRFDGKPSFETMWANVPAAAPTPPGQQPAPQGFPPAQPAPVQQPWPAPAAAPAVAPVPGYAPPVNPFA